MLFEKAKNIKLFEETMSLCDSDPALSSFVNDSISDTKIIDKSLENDGTWKEHKLITVKITDHKSFEAAHEIHLQNPEWKIGVLNFASATNPGGGVKTGASAQEEDLCRCSTLYPCLNTQELKTIYYNENKKAKNHNYTDTVIYTPNVVVLRSDITGKLYEKDEMFAVDVLSCAAPNLRGLRGKDAVPYDIQKNLHYRRGKVIMSAAASQHVDVLVLGAFGCGAFQNNPTAVATAYRELAEDYGAAFEMIEFAVYSPDEYKVNFNTFKRIFERK